MYYKLLLIALFTTIIAHAGEQKYTEEHFFKKVGDIDAHVVLVLNVLRNNEKDVNQCNEQGRTPLHQLCYAFVYHKEICKLAEELIRRGA